MVKRAQRFEIKLVKIREDFGETGREREIRFDF